MDSVIITGAGGFIGSAVVKAVAESGRHVIAVVRFQGKYPKLSSVEYLEGDLIQDSIWKDLKASQPTALLHLAAIIPNSFVGDSAQSAAEQNRCMDDKAIAFCEEIGARLIYASGASVYGLSYSGIRRENDKCDPIGPYLVEKYRTEKKIMNSSEIKNPCCLRINAPYGPNQRARTVICIFVENALRNQILYYYGSGARTQDFTYVDDIGNAFLLALNSNAQGVFNISGGQPISMRNLSLLVTKLIPNCTSEVKASDKKDPQESFRANYDISLANNRLFWNPKIGLKEGITNYIKFLKEQICE
jgi:nucleoside-diphosphate-sugar epimerase